MFFGIYGKKLLTFPEWRSGFTDGAGLGGSGDAVTLWAGSPFASTPVDMASYPDTENFDGQSYDIELQEFSVVGNANGAVQTLATGGSTGSVPNIGSPGNGLTVPTGFIITEIFPGQEGTDLTPDWFEIKNTGEVAWEAGISPSLYYDDDSADPADAVQIEGITELQPGASAVILITDNPDEIPAFDAIWSQVLDMSQVEYGYVAGSGLGSGGDAVTLWLGDPNLSIPVDTASYPEATLFDGQSYDVDLQAFSVVGNANGAVQTVALGGDNMDVPNTGSPGDGLNFPSAIGLEITEIFPGQMGQDLTRDWFEIKNNGSAAWVAEDGPGLFYDDNSSDPGEAVPVEGLTDIQPGESVIVIVSPNTIDINIFREVWSPVIDLTDIEIGIVDGAGLGGDGDGVTLWLGDPGTFLPVDTASFPNTPPFDGQSYDVELQAFSEVGNANGAVRTLAFGGNNMTVPNIGSPGNGLGIQQTTGLEITEVFAGQEGAGPDGRLDRDHQQRRYGLD